MQPIRKYELKCTRGGYAVEFQVVGGNVKPLQGGKMSKVTDVAFFNFATRAGTPQREPITVGPYHLTHPVYFLCGRKPECPEGTHDFRQSVGFYLSTFSVGGSRSARKEPTTYDRAWAFTLFT